MTLLTPEDTHHSIYSSPDGKYFFDNYSTLNKPTVTVLRSAKAGKVIHEVAKADVSSLKNWSTPEIFTALADDGETTLYGAVWRPTNFDPTKSYPVIEMSYTGLHTQVFKAATLCRIRIRGGECGWTWVFWQVKKIPQLFL